MGAQVPSKCCGGTNKTDAKEVDTELEQEFKRDKADDLLSETNIANECSSAIQKELEKARNEINLYMERYTEIKNESNNKYTQLKQQYQIEQEEKAKLLEQIQKNSRQYDELINSQNLLKQQFEKEIDKYKNQSKELQQQLVKTVEDMNKFKQSEQEQIIEYKKQQLENIKLNDIQTELKTKMSKLNELIDEFKQSKTTDNDNDNESQTNTIEIEKLQKQIDTLNNEKELMEQSQTVFDENNKLNILLNNISQQMEDQKSQNKTLKNQLIQVKKRNSVEHTHSIINEDIMIHRLKQKILTLQSKLDDFQKQSNSNDDEKLSENIENIMMTRMQLSTNINEIDTITDMDKIFPKPEKIDKSKSLPVHQISNREKDVNDNRVKDTLQTIASNRVIDVKAFVKGQYKTIDAFNETDTETETEQMQEDRESRESSLEPSEKLEIEQAKIETNKQKEMDEEVMAMKQELEQMQNEAAMVIQKEISALKTQLTGNVSFDGKLSDDEFERRDLEFVINDNNEMEEIMPDTDSNLIRESSKSKWNEDAVKKQKQEMVLALAHLVSTQVSASKSKEDNVNKENNET
eukprot:249965_1